MSSMTEVTVAKLMDERGIIWEYEPVAASGYIPDFKLTEMGCFLEVKGSVRQLDISKVKRFAEKNDLFVVDADTHLWKVKGSALVQAEIIKCSDCGRWYLSEFASSTSAMECPVCGAKRSRSIPFTTMREAQ